MTKKFGGGGTMEVENINIKRKELKQMMNVIKSKKKILFFTFLSMVVLFGCSNGEGLGASNNNGKEQSVAEKLYKDLDAKETYEKAIEYLNENVTYYKFKQIDENKKFESIIITERFNEDGKYNQIFSSYVNHKSDDPSASKEIIKDGKSSQLGSSNGVFGKVLDISNESYYESKQFPLFSVIYLREGFKLHDISKEEDGDHIIIKMKFENNYNVMSYDEETQNYVDKGEVHTKYQINETIIDSNGLIIEERVEPYADSTFEKKLDYSTTVWYGDFNKKTTFDYEEEKQKLKDLEGKDIDVIKDMFE